MAVQARADAPYALAELQGALEQPTFVLYLGRKSCPPSVPMAPRVVQADSLLEAFKGYRADRDPATVLPLSKLAWPDGMVSGVMADLSVTRKDRLIHRGAWQFGERAEHVAMLTAKGA